MVELRKPVSAPMPAPPSSGRRDDGLDCEICGARMHERSCKITCRNCGFHAGLFRPVN